MSDPMDFPVDSEDQLYDPPLVDSIYFDAQRSGFAITFIPSDDASTAMTEFVFIPGSSPDYPRVNTFWNRIIELLPPRVALGRVVHSGGGNYQFHFEDGSHTELAAMTGGDDSMEISDRLKQIADAAQIAFLDQSYQKAMPHGS